MCLLQIPGRLEGGGEGEIEEGGWGVEELWGVTWGLGGGGES